MTAFYWALFAACIWGVVPIIEKAGLNKVEPLVGLFYRCAGVLIGAIILGLFVLKPAEIKNVDPRSALFLMAGGVLASFVAQLTFYHALKIGEVSKVVPVVGTYYLISFLLGILLLKEPFTMPKLAGIILIASGMLLLR